MNLLPLGEFHFAIRRLRNDFTRALCCLLSMLASAALAQPSLPLRDAGARMEQVADGVYAIIHDDATDEWPHGNTGVVVGEHSVLVVDATYLPSRASADIALIRSVTDEPIRYLAYTHWHFDHNNGAIAYKEAYPDLAIVSERETRDFVVLNGTWWARRSIRTDQPKMVALAELEKQLAARAGPEGDRLSPDAIGTLERAIQRRRAELEELGTLTVVAPNVVFDRELTLDLGGRLVQLRDWGRANSPHDVTIFVPDARVLFAGDILVQAPVPYFTESWPVPWIDVLRQIEAVPAAAIVPGHGPVFRDHTYTRQVRAVLEAVTARVAAMAKQGRSLDEIQNELDLSDVRAPVAAWSGTERDEDWEVTTRTLIERAWRGVRGQGG
jgi:glyoxylase-like metal-dependent hydrolase (beta-lactamase superfamily II)